MSLLLHGPLKPNLPTLNPSTSSEELNFARKKIIWSSREVIAEKRFTSDFMFNLGLIPGLLVVIMSLPKVETEWEAVEVLRTMRGRTEGTWNSEEVANMGEGVLMLQDMTK
jgi:hypothetical protein